jgi:hypothetical protein
MCRSLILALCLTLASSAACGGGFDAKAQASAVGPAPRAPTDPRNARAAAPRPPLAIEPFALVKLAPELDLFGPLPSLPLPIDAFIERGTESGTMGKTRFSRRTMKIRFPGSYERFDSEVGNRIIAALPVPPDAAVVFRYEVWFGAGSYEGVAVRAKPLATVTDLVAAEVVPYGRVDINLDSDKAEETKLVALKVTLSDEAAKRLSESNADDPVVWLIDGRVVRKDDLLGKVDARRLVFEWSDPKEARATAEKLVAKVRAQPRPSPAPGPAGT